MQAYYVNWSGYVKRRRVRDAINNHYILGNELTSDYTEAYNLPMTMIKEFEVEGEKNRSHMQDDFCWISIM